MSALLPVKVEAALASTVYDILAGSSVTWTDISDYVLYSAGVSFNRGRTAEASNTSAGSLSFSVKTLPDGSTAGLALRTPVRVSWDDGSGWQSLWTGSVSEVRAGWNNGVRGVQEVSCVDNVAVAERVELESWPVAAARSVGDLVWMYPLDDADIETAPREIVGNVPVTMVVRPVGVPPENSAVTLGSVSAPVNDGTAAGFTGTAFAGGWSLLVADPLGRVPNNGVGGPFTLSVYVYIDQAPGRYMIAVSAPYDGNQNYRLDLGVDPDGAAYVSWSRPGGVETITGGGLTRGRWHHLAVRQFVTGGGTIYEVDLLIDGVEVGTSYSGAFGPDNLAREGVRIGARWDGPDSFSGRISAVGFFDAWLSDADIAELAGARNGFDQDSTVGRFNRLQRLAGFSTSTASGGIGVMGAQPLRGKSVAAAMGDCASVEHTVFHPTVSGTLTLASRATLWNNAVITSGSPPALAISAGVNIPAEAVAPSTSVQLDDSELANVITGVRVGGATYQARDAASIADFGEYRRSTTYPCGSDGELTTYVDADLADSAQPRFASESLTVDVVRAAASITVSDVLGVDIGDLLTVADLPADSPFAAAPVFRVVGIGDRVGTSGWSRTFNVNAEGTVDDLVSAIAATSGSPVAWVWKLDDSDYPLGARTGTTFDTRLGL